jgi:hypothetical protein
VVVGWVSCGGEAVEMQLVAPNLVITFLLCTFEPCGGVNETSDLDDLAFDRR